MAYFSTKPAPERTNPTGKNRVWDFFRLSNETHPANRRQSAQPRRKIGPTPTKTVSGIPYWPSRDPIEEKGGSNLYGFVGNDGVDRWDHLGNVAPVVVAVAGAAAIMGACMLPHYAIGKSKYPDDEEMRHCYTSCIAARTCGKGISELAGIGFEVLTAAFGDLDMANHIYDIANNLTGLDCAGFESGFGLGNLTRWFRASCDCCCSRRFGR
ncbi:MAG: hypothetical protein WCP35_18120 [Verrucomicrobiota bacterium]